MQSCTCLEPLCHTWLTCRLSSGSTKWRAGGPQSANETGLGLLGDWGHLPSCLFPVPCGADRRGPLRHTHLQGLRQAHTLRVWGQQQDGPRVPSSWFSCAIPLTPLEGRCTLWLGLRNSKWQVGGCHFQD